MRLLYLSCHEVLEYDELRLLTDLGHEVYSHGAYTMSGGWEGRKRPPLPDLPYDAQLAELMIRYGKTELQEQMLEGMDAVIVMHTPDFILANYGLLADFMHSRGGRVIWRSIGQSSSKTEMELADFRHEGMEIARYSPNEASIPGYMGSDALIRFVKDPLDFKPWAGWRHRVVNFTQHFTQRSDHCGAAIINQATAGIETKIYGPDNENLGDRNGGLLSWDAMTDVFSENRVYIYHGTYPASYTLSFIEAWMSGIPVVAVGPELGNAPKHQYNQSTYEVHQLLENGVSGFFSDNVQQMKAYIEELMRDQELAQKMSDHASFMAREIFGPIEVGKQWQSLLLR